MIKKRWPGDYDLLSWWIYHKTASAPMHDLDDPDRIREWLVEYTKLSKHGVHQILYAAHNNFRIEFVHPRYLDQPETASQLRTTK